VIVAGLMSGTSVDGVDVSLVDITGKGHEVEARLLGHYGYPYPQKVRKFILHVAERGTVAEACHLHAVLGEIFAMAVKEAVKACRIPLKRVELIGSHGQTVHHRPLPTSEYNLKGIRSTLQLGNPQVIAERTGIPTVSDFRSRDMAAGGEGAPLAPYAHYVLFSRKGVNRLVINLGGISNVTFLSGNKGDLGSVRAFDTGPCNMLLDGLVALASEGKKRLDRGGRQALQGSVHEGFLKWLLKDPYLSRHPPKSTGRERYGTEYVRRVWREGQRRKLGVPAMLATSCRFVAEVIGDARKWFPVPVNEVVIGGGGVYNLRLRRELTAVLAPASLHTMDACGSPATAFEAQAFAILAYQCIHGVYANLPRVTGARHAVVLGSVTPGGTTALLRNPDRA
jgi:anhydro-N-acetylmuramic acid kinase